MTQCSTTSVLLKQREFFVLTLCECLIFCLKNMVKLEGFTHRYKYLYYKNIISKHKWGVPNNLALNHFKVLVLTKHLSSSFPIAHSYPFLHALDHLKLFIKWFSHWSKQIFWFVDITMFFEPMWRIQNLMEIFGDTIKDSDSPKLRCMFLLARDHQWCLLDGWWCWLVGNVVDMPMTDQYVVTY